MSTPWTIAKHFRFRSELQIPPSFTYANHLDEGLSVETTNYDARPVNAFNDDALSRWDDAVAAIDEGHLTNGIAMNLDELFACHCLIIRLINIAATRRIYIIIPWHPPSHDKPLTCANRLYEICRAIRKIEI